LYTKNTPKRYRLSNSNLLFPRFYSRGKLMLKLFTALLHPPSFEEEEIDRTASLLHWSLMVILGSSVLLPLSFLIIVPGERLFINALLGVASVCFLILIFLLHRGFLRLVSWLFPFLVWLGFSLPIYGLDGIYDTAIIGYFIVIVLSALLLGRWVSGMFCLLSVGSAVAAYYLQAIGVITVESRAEPFIIDLILLAVSLAATTLLLNVAVRRITEGYTQARRNQRAVEQLNQALEEKVAERTRQLDQANQQLRQELALRKTAVEELRDSKEKYRLVVENAVEAIVVAQDGKLKFFNRRLMDFARGYTQEEMKSLPFTEFIHPDDRELVLSRHWRRMQGEDIPQVYFFRVIDKDGEVTWVEINTVRVDWENKPAVLFFMTDVSERVQAERALRESETRFRVLFQSSPDAIVLIDPHSPEADWPIIECNDTFCRMNGYTRQELIGQSINIVNTEPPKPGEREAYLEQLRCRSPIILETLHRHKDGFTFPVQISTALITLGERETVLGIDRDITEQVQAQQALRHSEARYRQLVKHAPAGIYELDLTTNKLVTVNDVMCQFLGYTREELLSMSVADLLFEEGQRHFAHRMRRVLAGEEIPETVEFRVKGKHGQEYWALLNVRVLFEHGQPVRAAVVAHDITQRKQAEQELRESEEKYRALTENSKDIIMRFDRKFRHLYVNPAVSTVLPQLEPVDLIGKTHTEMDFPPELCHYWEGMIQKVFDTGQVWEDTFELPAAAGRIVIYWQLIPEFNEAGEVETVLATSRDITRQKEAEEALKQARTELEQKVQARTTDLTAANVQLKASLQEKEVLLQEIHHRVKNNMQVISSLLNLQSSSVDNPQALEMLQDSQQRVRSMALIHEKLYRSDNLARIDFAEYINDLTSTLFHSYNAHRKGITLALQADNVFLGLDQAVPCGLIINELLSNALKHAFPNRQGGEIRIGLHLTEPQQVTLTIADNGAGFPADLDFRKTDSLGLQLVNTLVNQLDGTIEIEVDQGTRFMIMFRNTVVGPS
jgi:PAS domain S-box-containing protein